MIMKMYRRLKTKIVFHVALISLVTNTTLLTIITCIVLEVHEVIYITYCLFVPSILRISGSYTMFNLVS